jgi:hypothetical protein
MREVICTYYSVGAIPHFQRITDNKILNQNPKKTFTIFPKNFRQSFNETSLYFGRQ